MIKVDCIVCFCSTDFILLSFTYTTNKKVIRKVFLHIQLTLYVSGMKSDLKILIYTILNAVHFLWKEDVGMGHHKELPI